MVRRNVIIGNSRNLALIQLTQTSLSELIIRKYILEWPKALERLENWISVSKIMWHIDELSSCQKGVPPSGKFTDIAATLGSITMKIHVGKFSEIDQR